MATFNSATYVKPVVNGSSGNWGNLLNTVIDQVDTDFTAIDTRIDTLEAVTHVTTFAGLTDTPSSLSGQAGKTLKVNSSGNAIEFVTETVPTNVQDLSNVTVSSPSTGEVLKWNGSAWTNQADASGGGGISVSEARQAISLSVLSPSGGQNAQLAYSDSTGQFTFAPPDLSGYVSSSSPSFTGTPSAPTAVSSTNTTQIATTAFVQSATSKVYTSGWQNFGTFSTSSVSTFSHSLGGEPDMVMMQFKCTTANLGYSVGDIINTQDGLQDASNVFGIFHDNTTQIKVVQPYYQRVQLVQKSNGQPALITSSSWQWRVKCVKI